MMRNLLGNLIMKREVNFITLIFLVFLSNISYPQITTIWSKLYGNDKVDEAYFVSPTITGGSITCGAANGFESNVDMYILNLDANGDTLWSRIIGEIDTQERGLCVRQTIDSCFIVTGYVEIDYGYRIYLSKLDGSGETLWFKLYGSGDAKSVIQTSDQGYLIAADISTSSDRYSLLLKTDKDGNEIWRRSYNFIDAITKGVLETSKGDFVVCCQGFAISENKHVELYCVDSSGNLKWQLFNDKYSRTNSAIELPDKSIVAVGGISTHFNTNVRIIKVDEAGSLISEKEYGMGDYIYCEGVGLALINEKNFLINSTVRGYGDIVDYQWAWFLALDINLDTLWTKIVDTSRAYIQSGQFNSICKISENQYYAAGWFQQQPDYKQDIWVMKFSLDSTISGIEYDKRIKTSSKFILEQNYPNPFNPKTKINYSIPQNEFVVLKVYDILGTEITTLVNGNQTKGDHSIEFNATNLHSGIYFYKINSGSYSEVKKLIVMK